MVSVRSPRGFTLVETLVATAVLVTALAGIAQLLVLSAQWSRSAAGSNGALIAAQEKLEELRGAPFGYDGNGVPISDPALEPSPPTSLEEDIAPYADLAGGGILARRWRVSSLDERAPDAIVIEVCVFREGASQAETCLSTIRTRQS